MRSHQIFSLFLGIFLLTSLSPVTESQVIHTGEEQLDGESYILKWNITSDEIHFEVVVQTTGYVGLGISPTGGMTGADIFIAGVYDNGTAYSSDRHATSQSLPIVDQQSDWTLDASDQTATHTTLRFHRLLNTCDEEGDQPITDETTRIIWAVGNSDTIEQHGKRGTKSINFFLQDDTEFDPEKYEKHDIIANSSVPAQHTSYLCTFHEGPTVTGERHFVAFEPVFNNPLALAHTHHFSIFRCVPPEGKSPEEVFGPHVNQQGKHCYDESEPVEQFPMRYCSDNLVYVWSKGGKKMVFPPEIGYPIPGQRDRKEYYAMEVHYDNPTEEAREEFTTGGRMYYTKENELRETEAQLLIIIHDTAVQLTIPPKSPSFVVSGHCGGACTDAHLPDEGITIFNNLFHSHLKGRKMKLRHFRGEKELPWIDVDDHYDFDYQQSKPLSKPVKIMKGDQLTIECTYDNSGDQAVIGGLSTKNEMCQAILYVYPKTPLWLCDSSQPTDKHFEFLGITNTTLKNSTLAGELPLYDILEPESLAGDYLESMSSKFVWSEDFRREYQQEKVFGVQEASCCIEGAEGTECTSFDVTYPEKFEEYVPTNECTGGGDGGGTEFLRPNFKGIVVAFISLYVLLNQ